MKNSPQFRLAAIGIAIGALAAGCGRGGSSHQAGEATSVPRPIELPARLRPIALPHEAHAPKPAREWAPAQYEEAPSGRAPNGPRIRELGAASIVASDSRIGQPSTITPATEPQPSALPTSIPPQRSEFVPIALPDSAAPPAGSPPPQFAARPAFERTAAAPAESSNPVAAQGDGPQLTDPQQTPGASVVEPAVPPADAFQSNTTIAAAALPSQANMPTPFVPLQDAAPPALQQYANTANDPALAVVAQRAMHMADQAAALAQRGMLYSARTELVQALQLIAQALDVREGSTRHATALSLGLTALREARDFSAVSNRAGEPVNVGLLASGHRTAIVSKQDGAQLSPVIAQQQYFGYAQVQLIEAVRPLPAGSQILYRLGRLETALAAHESDSVALHGPQAIVFHQAAMAIDGNNWLAANELGVLMARYGQLPEARRLLQHSVALHPHVEGWQNLAVVHRRLGEATLAEQAENERRMLAQRSAQQTQTANEMVRWVDPKTFAASGGQDVHWTADSAAKAAANSPGTARR